MSLMGQLPEELVGAMEVYKQYQDRWQQEGPLYLQRNLHQDFQTKQYAHLDMQDQLNRAKVRIQLSNLRVQNMNNNGKNADVSVFLLFCQGLGLTNLQPQVCAVVNYSELQGKFAEFTISQSWEWLLVVIREDLFSNKMLGQKTTVKHLITEMRENFFCGFLQLGHPLWVFAYPLQQIAFAYGGGTKNGATIRLRKGQLSKVEGGINRIRVDYCQYESVPKSPISDFYVNVVGQNYINNLRAQNLELEIITQVMLHKNQDFLGDNFSCRGSFTVVEDSCNQPKFYNFVEKKGVRPFVLIKYENDCAICGYEAATYLGLCLHISCQHSMFVSTFNGNQINIRINQQYLDASGEFIMPHDVDVEDQEFVMANGKHESSKMLEELKPQVCLEDNSQQLRISASPSKQINLGKLNIVAKEKGQENKSKQNIVQRSSSKPKFDPKKQIQIRDKYINHFGTRFFSSTTQAPITQEQLDNLKDSDDEQQEDVELQKQLAWAEIEENLQCFSVNAKKVKFLWKLHLQYNPCHADKYLFDSAQNFVQKHEAELSESVDMIREVQAHFQVFYQKFSLLTVAQLAALLRPLRNRFYNQQQNNP